jgi:hypothetical protein
MGKEWKDWTDEELANEAQAGVRGQGALVEAMRRLRDGSIEQQNTANRLATKIYWLTWAMLAAVVVQIALMVFKK